MSIESDLSSIAKSLALIADLLTVKTAHTAVAASVANPATVAVEAAPVPKPVVMDAPVQPAAPTITSGTTNTATTVGTAPTPATLTKEQFMSEIMATYKALGPVKGAGIQQVLSAHGAVNINDVKPEQYAGVLAQVKAL